MKLRFVEESLLNGHKRYFTESSEDGKLWIYVSGSLSSDKGIAYRQYETCKNNQPQKTTVLEECEV